MILDDKLDPEEKKVLYDLLIAVAGGLAMALAFKFLHVRK